MAMDVILNIYLCLCVYMVKDENKNRIRMVE